MNALKKLKRLLKEIEGYDSHKKPQVIISSLIKRYDQDFNEDFKSIAEKTQIKQFILLHDSYKFWYTLTKIKRLNIYNGKSCVGRRLLRKHYISQDHITRRQKIN